jgi:ferritin-like metal-binding protein YciE
LQLAAFGIFLYSPGHVMVKALPKMAKAATSSDLRSGFEEHLKQTQEHVARLEQIFEALGESPKGKSARVWKVQY